MDLSVDVVSEVGVEDRVGEARPVEEFHLHVAGALGKAQVSLSATAADCLAVADALVESTRTTDLVARYGSDQFVVLLVDAGHDQVEIIVDRVKAKLVDLVKRRALPRRVECNLGVVVSPVPPESAEEMMREADLEVNRRRI